MKFSLNNKVLNKSFQNLFFLFVFCLINGISFYYTFCFSSSRLIRFVFDNKAIMTFEKQKLYGFIILGISLVLFFIILAVNLLIRKYKTNLKLQAFWLSLCSLTILPMCFVIKWLVIPGIENRNSACLTTLIILSVGVSLFGLFIFCVLNAIGKSKLETIKVNKFSNIILFTVIFLTIAYVVFMSWLTIQRYLSFNASYGDFTNYHNIVWNSSEGRLLGNYTVSSQKHMPWHFDPILILISVFYWIYSSPETLLVVQTLFVGLAGFLIFLLAKYLIKSDLIALVFAISFFLHPATHGMNYFDAHSLTFSSFTILLTIYMIEREKLIGIILSLFLLLITREDMALIGILLGIYIILSGKKFHWGVGMIIISFLYFVFAMKLMSYYGESRGSLHYDDMIVGDSKSMFSVLFTSLTNPIYTLKIVFTKPKIIYFLQMSIPLLFLYFRSRWGIVLLGYSVLLHLFATNWQQYSLIRHYAAPTLPLLYYTSILGLRNILSKSSESSKLKVIITVMIFMASLGISFCFGMLPLKYNPFGDLLMTERKKEFIEVLSRIPQEKSVSAQTCISPFLGKRKKIYQFPVQMQGVDYNVLDTWGNMYPIKDRSAYLKEIEELLLSPRYGVIYYGNDFMILERYANRSKNKLVLEDIKNGGTNVLYPGKGNVIQQSGSAKVFNEGAFNSGSFVFKNNGFSSIQITLPRDYWVNELYIRQAGTDLTTEDFVIKISYADESKKWLVLDELKEVNIGIHKGSKNLPLSSIENYHKVFDPIKIRHFKIEFYGNGWFTLGDVRLFSRVRN